MSRFFSNYALTVISVLVTFLLELIAHFALHLNEAELFIILAVGLLTSLVVVAFEHKLPQVLEERLREFSVDLKLNRYLHDIGDQQLRDELVDTVQKTAGGEISGPRAEEFVRRSAAKVSHLLWGSDWRVSKEGFLGFWRSGEGFSWLELNKKVVERGVRVERHFILDRTWATTERGSWDEDVLMILEEHAKRFTIGVIWVDEIQQHAKRPWKELLQDFVILDGEIVSTIVAGETRAFKLPSKQVEYYKGIFEAQSYLALDLDKALNPSQARGR